MPHPGLPHFLVVRNSKVMVDTKMGKVPAAHGGVAMTRDCTLSLQSLVADFAEAAVLAARGLVMGAGDILAHGVAAHLG